MPCRTIRIITLLILLLGSGAALRADEARPLTVVWVSDGDLWGWREDQPTPVSLATGDVQEARLSPDQGRVAFTRGVGGAESLWVSDWTAAQQWVAPDQLPPVANGTTLIVRFAWLDNATLWFNTGQQFIPRQRIVLQDDLWRADASSLTPIFAAGEGGDFSLSPDRRYATLTRAGQYNDADGRLRLLEIATGAVQEVVSFPAISTGSNYDYYPPIFWSADSRAFTLALPAPDLIYHDSARETTLWRMRLDGAPERLGSVTASFFGLPQWSFDGVYLTYTRRTGADSNQLELVLARGDGSAAQVVAAGEVGTLGTARWLPDANHFVYEQGSTGHYWIGGWDEPAQPLPALMFAPQFLSEGWVVFASGLSGTFQLQYQPGPQAVPIAIVEMTTTSPVFDAGR